MWVPNSFAGHKMWSLEGENEIPPIAIFDFFSKNVFFNILAWTGQNMRYWIWGPVGFKPEYLLTYLSYLNSDKCILIPIEFPLIWYIMGLSRSKFDWFSRVWRSVKFLSVLGVIFSTDILNIKIGLVGKWSILATFFIS